MNTRIPPSDLDTDALKILREAGFIWDSELLAFHRKASHSTIDYWFLRDQQLIVNTPLDERARIGQLQRLRIVLTSMD